jgi:hypothetical protein
MSDYFCKECLAPASVGEGGAISRTCGHRGTILAGLSATVYGESWARAGVSTRAMIVLRNLVRKLLALCLGVKGTPKREA